MKRVNVKGQRGLVVQGDVADGPLVLPSTPGAPEDGQVLAWDNDAEAFAWTTPGGGSGAPTTADYLVRTADAGLSAERVVTDTSDISWDWATAGQAKASLAFTVTTAAKSVLDDTTVADMRTTLGIGTAGRCAVVTAQGITPATGYEIATVQGQRYLRTLRRTDYPVARTIAAASPEYGWTWANRTALDAANENTTTANGAYWDHGNTSTDWVGPGTFTAPWRYRSYAFPQGRVFVVTARIACNGDQTYEYAHIMATIGSGNTPFVRGGPGWESAGGPQIGAFSTTGTSVAITTAQRDAGVWVRMVIDRERTQFFYSTSSSSTPPTSWTLLQSYTPNWGATVATIRLGMVMLTVNTSNTFTASYLYYDVQWMDNPSGVFNDSMSGLLWPATQYDSSGTEQLLADDIDLGADAPSVDNTRLRLILADLENRLQHDSATVTWSYKTSATTGATSGTFRAAGSVVNDGAGGRYLRLWVKITSDGDTQGSIGPFPFTIPTS